MFRNRAFAAHLFEGLALHGKPDSMKHEPCGLLRDAKNAVDFVRTNSVLRAPDQPHGGKPLRQGNRTFFEDQRPSPRTLAIWALPHAASSQIARALAGTIAARRLTVRPSQIGEELDADVFVREVNHRLLKSFGESVFAHARG